MKLMKLISALMIVFTSLAFSTAVNAESQAIGMTCKTKTIFEEIKSKKTSTMSSDSLVAQRIWKSAAGSYSLSYFFNEEVEGVDQATVLGSSVRTTQDLPNGLKLQGSDSRGLFVNKKGRVTDYAPGRQEVIEEQTGPQEWSTWSVKDGQKNELLSRATSEELEGARRKVSTVTVKLEASAELRTVSNEIECISSSLSQQDFEALAHDSKITQDLADLDRLFLKWELDGNPESLAKFEEAWNFIYVARRKRLEKTYAEAVARNHRHAKKGGHSIRQPYERTPAEMAAACAIWNRNTLGLVPTPSCPKH